MALIIFFLFVALNAVIFLLRNKPKASYVVAYCIAVYLLVYKIGEYTYWQAIGEHMHFPVEFSALSYFLFGIAVTFRLKKVDSFATFCAMLAGLMYSVSFWVSPDSFVSGEDNLYWLVTAIINHHLLYLGGMLMVLNVRKFRLKDIYQHLVGVGILVGYSWIIHSFTDYTAIMGKPIIIQITDGSILTWLFHSEPSTGALVGYYIFAVVLVLVVTCGILHREQFVLKTSRKERSSRRRFPRKIIDGFHKRQSRINKSSASRSFFVTKFRIDTHSLRW